MLVQQQKIALALLAAVATATVSAPSPAKADTASTALIAGLAGLVVGGLLFDSSRNQYYYNYSGHRRYVTNAQAQTYYQRADPQYYNAHRNEFANHAQFAHNWDAHHGHHR